MTNNDEIRFDAASGISEEEQREILAAINGIAEKNRQSLAAGAEDSNGKKKSKRRFKAKKSGGVFPVLVNIAAIAALAGGFFVLSSFQGKTDAQVREGTKVYNVAERALIEEIRKETSSRLEAKENEIALMSSRLEGVGAELQALYSSRQDLSAEQQEAESRLIASQEEYRAALAQLQDERSLILDEARAREASLQAQLESRTRELALVAEQSEAAVDLARGELEKISREQGQVSAAEAHMAGLFANLNASIADDRLDEASSIVTSMRNFLETPAFQSLRYMQSRKELYLQAINSFESMIDEAKKNLASLAVAGKASAGTMEDTIANLQTENELLKKNVEDLTATVASVSSQGTGLAERLTELGNQVSKLQGDNSTLNRQVSTLEGENSTLNRQNRELRTSGETKDRSIAALETEKTGLNKTISDLQAENAQAKTDLGNANRELADTRTRVQTLTSLNTTLSATVQDLSNQLNRDQPQPAE